jgi:tetratricopeptide (TPR) repeat protein
MGVVYRAIDTFLGREIAIKVLHEQYAPGSAVARRFLDEAHIAGHLQHPGVPPVHDLGTLPDGRPFLVMKLIKGCTLDELLRDRADPCQDRGRFVAVFEHVCQAVGYAHAHDVVHRDLKPANVMVGAFGEVQVMDWGLAKLLTCLPRNQGHDPGDPVVTTAETVIRSIREQDDATRAGSVLGTPAYMPPEQAIGAIDQIDQRSDVFGLGAILCTILTGKPPFLGADAESTRQLAARAKLDEALARLDTCGAEPDLVALCKRCLSVEKADRLPDAGVLAREVADLRSAANERARRAELDRVRAEGERASAEAQTREQRKRRRVQLALAAAVGLLLLGGGLVAWWQQRQWSEHETERRLTESANRQAAASALYLAEEAMRKDNPIYGEIDAALDQAERRVAPGGADDLRERLQAALAARRVLQRLDQLANQRWTVAHGKSFLDVAGARDGYRAVFQEYGISLSAATTEALAERVRQSLIAGPIQAALDDWLGVSSDRRLTDDIPVDPKLIDLLAALDPNPERTAVRRAIACKDQAVLTTSAAGLEGRTLPPSFAVLVCSNMLVPEECRLGILREAQAANPGHFGLAMTISYALPMTNVYECVANLRIAVALRPSNAVARNNLGSALHDKGDLDGAMAEYKEAIRLDPKFPNPHVGLGRVLVKKRFQSRAMAEFKQAIRLDPKSSARLSEWVSSDAPARRLPPPPGKPARTRPRAR